jgi:aminoglycoside phosphotransferase (APT) family kinase protein
MAWNIPPGSFRGIAGIDVEALGIPTQTDYIRLYCEHTQLASPDELKADWNFYMAYNMFRIAAILQGIAKRVEAGTASSAQAVSSGAGAKPLAQLAWKFAQQA